MHIHHLFTINWEYVHDVSLWQGWPCILLTWVLLWEATRRAEEVFTMSTTRKHTANCKRWSFTTSPFMAMIQSVVFFLSLFFFFSWMKISLNNNTSFWNSWKKEKIALSGTVFFFDSLIYHRNIFFIYWLINIFLIVLKEETASGVTAY